MDNLIRAKERIKKFTDRRCTERSFEVGDKVLLQLQPYKQSTTRGAMPHKLSPRFFGPYLILEKIGTFAYHIELPPDTKIHVSHVSQLKKFEGREINVQCNPPSFWEVKPKTPKAVLERRMIKRGN